MTEATEADAVRPLAPTGAPGVGEPPVTVFEIVEASRRGDLAPVAAAQRAFPGLSAAEVGAALACGADAGADLRPDPARAAALWLLLARCLGRVWLLLGVLLQLGAALACLELVMTDDPVGVVFRAATASGVGLALGAVGFGIWGLRGWGRWPGVASAFLFIYFGMQTLQAGYVLFGFAGLLLAHPGVGRWCGTEGRAAARLVATRTAEAVIVSACLLGWLLAFVVPAFKKMFDETGVALSGHSEAVLSVSDLVADYWYVLLIGALAGFVALGPRATRIPREIDRLVAWPVYLLAAGALANLIVGLLLPMVQLFQKL